MALNFLLKRTATASKRPVAASMAFGEVDINYDSTTGGLFYKNSANAVVKVGPAQVSATAPNATPAGSSGNSVGEFWYDTSVPALKIWTGSAWVTTGGGGGGSGTVTSITAGTGLTGGTITTSGTIALDTSGVTANSYTYASITVDTYGRVTAASNGTAPLALSGGTMTGDITFNSGQTFPGTVGDLDFQAKGDLVAGYGANSFGILPVGTDGQVLSANSACVSGLEWVAAGGGGGSGTVTSITAGTGLTGGTITTSGTVALDTACVVQPSAYTAKGVLLAGSAVSTPSALTLGTNGQVLTVDDTCANGVKWAAAGGGGGGIPTTCITGKGALVTGTAADTPVALAVGANGAVLTACSACTNGIYWNTLTSATPTRLGNVFGMTDGSGKLNTALGCNALATATVAGNLSCFNVALGVNAMAAIDTDNCFNTAVGYLAGFNIFSTLNNVLIGTRAGCALSTGSNNTFVGTQDTLCANTTTGSNNVLLGYNARTAAATSNNTITLGNASITTIRANVTTISSLSDSRDKTNIVDLPVGLEFIKSLNPVKFTWQRREPDEVMDGRSEAGFIAQDLAVAQDAANADYLGLVYDENPDKLEATPGKLIPVLVKAIQELEARLAALENN
jgi:hypothetical protein